MSDRVVESYQEEGEGTNEQSFYPCESVWMAHWKCTSCKSETKACGHVSIHYEEALRNNNGVQKHPLFRGFGEVDEPKQMRKNNEGVILTESLKKLRKERCDEDLSFPMFNVPAKTSLARQNQQDLTADRRLVSESNLSAMQGWAPTDVWPLEAIRPLNEPQVKYHNFFEDNSRAVCKSQKDGAVRSDSKLALHQFKCGSTSMPLFFGRDKEVSQSNSVVAPPHVADTNNCSSSTYLFHEENISSKLASRTLRGSVSRQNDVMMLQRDPSVSRRLVKEMQSKSRVGLFPSRSTSPEFTRHEKAYREFCSAPNLPYQTMRICAAVDAEKESSSGHPKSYQTTPFPGKTGVKLSEGGHMFGESAVSTNLKGKALNELLVSPEHDFPVQTGLKLLPYRSCVDIEEEDVRDVKRHAKNLGNSSSETDTMDIDAFTFQDNILLGVPSSTTNEHTEGAQKSPTFRSVFTSARDEVRDRPPLTKLPDMNQELPELAAFASLADERETSPSSTQSLDVEHLLSHAEQPTNSKSSASTDDPQRLEPSCRWVKRLKLSDYHFAYGTKSTKMGEASSHENVNSINNKTMKCSVTYSQPAMGGFHGRKHMALNGVPMLLRKGESSSSDSARTSQNISLSHPWIRRWSHKVVAPHNHSEAAVNSQPQSSNATSDQFSKKKFPSIAAMALMGKAMNGFSPCEFEKKGSFVVWNTKGF